MIRELISTLKRVTVVHVLPERWDGPQRQDANADEMRRSVEHQFRQLLQVTVRDASGETLQ